MDEEEEEEKIQRHLSSYMLSHAYVYLVQQSYGYSRL
jgi:hypothetical protein